MADSLKENYEGSHRRYERLAEEALFILKEAISAKKIKIHSLYHRVKTYKSFLEKAKRKQYEDPIVQIQDLVGLRVVCLFLSDIKRLGEIVRETFEVISEDDKIDSLDISTFGYFSVHFIVRLKRDCSGPRYEGLKDILLEVQIRTMAMDAWATISHYLDYKSDSDVPQQIKKDFIALSGLFYVADTHFEMFFKEKRKMAKTIKESFKKTRHGLDQAINLDSLSEYLKKKYSDRRQSSLQSISELVGELGQSEYKTIREVDEALKRGTVAFLEYEKEHPPGLIIKGEKDNIMPRESQQFVDVGVVRITLQIVNDKFLKLHVPEEKEFRNKCELYSKYRKLLK